MNKKLNKINRQKKLTTFFKYYICDKLRGDPKKNICDFLNLKLIFYICNF